MSQVETLVRALTSIALAALYIYAFILVAQQAIENNWAYWIAVPMVMTMVPAAMIFAWVETGKLGEDV